MNMTAEEIRQAVEHAGLHVLPENVPAKLVRYLELLLRWNARLNLSAIRNPEEIVRRHFVESLFAAQQLPNEINSLLDYGSGAGFPGLPIAISRPEIQVTLAESQAKKASFLREAVRVTEAGCSVFEGRVETLTPETMFDVVTMRAVETMETAIPFAAAHASRYLALMITEESAARFHAAAPDWNWWPPLRLPNSQQMIFSMGHRL
jgi:16S rRNA (guanine527-N7)-methyltransferase